MEEVLQKLTELINVLENNSVPLWLSIFGIIVPIIISVAVVIITIINNRRDKDLQRQINEKNTELEKLLSDRDVRIQMHADFLKIYDDFCFAQNAIGMMGGRFYLIFSNFSTVNGVCFPTVYVNNLNTALNVLCQAMNKAKLLFPENEVNLRAAIDNIYNKYKNVTVKINEYYYSGLAYNTCQIAWSKMPSIGVFHQDYNLLMNDKKAYDAFLLNCRTSVTNEIDKETEELLKLFEYDAFDKYFEKYLRIDAERGQEGLTGKSH